MITGPVTSETSLKTWVARFSRYLSTCGLARDLPGKLGVASCSILSRGPNLSRKPPETQGKGRSVFEKKDG